MSQCPLWAESLKALATLNAHQTANGDSIVPEVWLLGRSNWGGAVDGRVLVALEEMFAASACRDWVTSHSDSEGRTAYAMTEAGRAVLDGLDNAIPPATLEYDGDAADCYLDALRAARAALSAAVPLRTNAVVIPLSCGLWPGRSKLRIQPLIEVSRKRCTPKKATKGKAKAR